jgi:hypothetical protein
MVRSRGLLGIGQHWELKLLGCFHDVVTSFIVLLDMVLNAFQHFAELRGVTGRSYIKDLILELGYLTVVAVFCHLISPIVKPVSVLFPALAIFANPVQTFRYLDYYDEATKILPLFRARLASESDILI